MDLEERTRELISKIEYLNIATSTLSGNPWNTPVYAVANDHLIFYWSSWKDAQHSINIRSNSKVFCTLYDTTRKRGDNNRRCLYFDGVATEIERESEILKGIQLLYPTEMNEMNPVDFSGDGLRRIYSVTPVNAWLNDISERQVTSQTIKMRIEINLEKLAKLT
ncbi:MAG TPA: pyridoxamine 5'-phosphate oxidase family protein [Oligoflexia bacterium]|mgnify:CR=1 FL=1|nr:pyridoxamine 5'-phosphate oxidase family protein [Oligoflexia bacterium]HMP49210.1 pyridoxamine 5'-phosphate oxidase family protein [Oligoflexia bacterium]